MKTLIAAATVYGIMTMYSEKDFGGNPLFCNTPKRSDLFYNDKIAFVALPVEDFISGNAKCGDWVRIKSDHGVSFWAQAWDAGPFGKNTVKEFGNAPIRVDVSEYIWPFPGKISARASVFNESALNRALTDAKVGHLREAR